MSFRARLVLPLLGALAASCASARWPDERGKPVAPSRATNLATADRFMDALTARRREANLRPPVVAGRLQIHFEKIADALQRGELSVPEARREAERWGRETYKRDAEASVVDCTAGALVIPSDLTSRPTLVISYAAARFHLRSVDNEQCAVLVVAVTGADQVLLQGP